MREQDAWSLGKGRKQAIAKKRRKFSRIQIGMEWLNRAILDMSYLIYDQCLSTADLITLSPSTFAVRFTLGNNRPFEEVVPALY